MHNHKREAAKNFKVTDKLAPEPQILGCAVCPTPSDFVAYRARIGNPIYAITRHDDPEKEKWYFFDSLEDGVAFALDWHKLHCKVEQFSQLQDDDTYAFAYRVSGLNNPAVDQTFYQRWIWESVTGDKENIYRAATPKVMTLLRQELFRFICEGHIDGVNFTMLDFSRPDGEAEFFRDWEDDLA